MHLMHAYGSTVVVVRDQVLIQCKYVQYATFLAKLEVFIIRADIVPKSIHVLWIAD